VGLNSEKLNVKHGSLVTGHEEGAGLALPTSECFLATNAPPPEASQMAAQYSASTRRQQHKQQPHDELGGTRRGVNVVGVPRRASALDLIEAAIAGRGCAEHVSVLAGTDEPSMPTLVSTHVRAMVKQNMCNTNTRTKHGRLLDIAPGRSCRLSPSPRT